MTHETRVRLSAAAILAVVFVAGLAVGMVVDRGTAHASPDPPEESASGPRDARPPSGWIIDGLEMTSEQRSQVDSVVAHFGTRMREFRREYGSRFRAAVDSTNQALQDILDDDQWAEYDSLKAEVKRRRGHDRSDSSGSR